MARQIVTGAGPSVQELEHRIAVLERQVAELTETTRALAAALEHASPAIPGGGAPGLVVVPAPTC
ncbi:hypothetical protein [Actinomadura formosensis]|uniref:hypothetical protein n=1 Tax=Actinomadura formosensis TaxID=60706 RepID=UPI0008337752|nr:hypothetical protein [Actinomadura formosensis]